MPRRVNRGGCLQQGIRKSWGGKTSGMGVLKRNIGVRSRDRNRAWNRGEYQEVTAQ